MNILAWHNKKVNSRKAESAKKQTNNALTHSLILFHVVGCVGKFIAEINSQRESAQPIRNGPAAVASAAVANIEDVRCRAN